jgi:CelD/BcsL family acetyltransferase involved in cellulose biosynthesis
MLQTVGGQRNPMCDLKTQRNASSAHATELQTDWELYYSQKRSAATRRNDRKKLKKIGEFGAVEFRSPAKPEEIQGLLSALIEQKSTKFAKMGVANIFAKPGYTEFFTTMATNARLLVHVSALQVGTNAAATNLRLTFRGCYYHVLASYNDGPVARFGAGAAHLHELMRYAIGSGFTRFDFTIGDEPYKRDWSDSELRLYDHVSGVGAVSQLVALTISTAIRFKRFMKTTPAIWALVQKVRALA